MFSASSDPVAAGTVHETLAYEPRPDSGSGPSCSLE